MQSLPFKPKATKQQAGKKKKKCYSITVNPARFLWVYHIFFSPCDVLWVSAGRWSSASSCLSFNSHNFTRRLLLQEHNLWAKNKASLLLNEPFYLFKVESLFFIKQLKSSAWGMVVFLSTFCETMHGIIYKHKIGLFLTYTWFLAQENWKSEIIWHLGLIFWFLALKQAWMVVWTLFAENSVLCWLEAPCGRQTHLTLVHHQTLLRC